jgi:hypothetical protein
LNQPLSLAIQYPTVAELEYGYETA